MNDVIVAVATPKGVGAISVIRMSGIDALSILSSCFSNYNKIKDRVVCLGKIYDDRGVIDEVLVSYFQAPRSYTGEDVIEISCHGGSLVTWEVLELLLDKGARIADPGEFSKRAYLNAKLSLDQAETVMDIIDAQSKMQLKLANSGMGAERKNIILGISSHLTELITKIEVNIDYPEYEDEQLITVRDLIPIVLAERKVLQELLDKAKTALLVRQGVSVLILGKPNVGKSTILNLLLEDDVAIVSDIPGTTRDFVIGTINIDGLICRLIDSAGVCKTTDPIETFGIKRTLEKISEVDLFLLVIDGSEKLDDTDRQLVEQLQSQLHLVIVNKTDKKQLVQIENALYISAWDKGASKLIQKAISEKIKAPKYEDIDATYFGNIRQINLLRQAFYYLEEALQLANAGEVVDIISNYIYKAHSKLQELTGQADLNIVDEIFSRFCLGK
jgi:tRNA modification GTPase